MGQVNDKYYKLVEKIHSARRLDTTIVRATDLSPSPYEFARQKVVEAYFDCRNEDTKKILLDQFESYNEMIKQILAL